MSGQGRLTFDWPPLRSRLPGMTWPAVPGQEGQALAVLLAQFEQSQWLPEARIERLQLRQLFTLIDHARRHSRFYAERLADFRADAERNLRECLSSIQPLQRADLQSRRSEIDCAWLPSEHGQVTVARSTGSTGEPVAVRRSGLNNLIWMAMTLREHLWQRRDFSQPLAIIRAQLAADDMARHGVAWKNWGPPTSHLFASGPSYGLNLQTDIARQAEWLLRIKPAYLLTYPNNLSALLDLCEETPNHLNSFERLAQVRTIGETLTDALRERCFRTIGAEIADLYSTQEVGVIAIECPEKGGYHVMAEGVILELLRDDGTPCAPGEIGRVVVTDLHNFATPLIRYALGDLAEAAGPCDCGRGLPKIRRIVGRERNLLQLPDGRRYWPLVGMFDYRDIAPVRQCQVIQRSLEYFTMRLVVERRLTAGEERLLAEKLAQAIGFSVAVDFEYFVDRIPRGEGGKFEDFINEMAASPPQA